MKLLKLPNHSILILFIALILITKVEAQRPKIGLTLSGGGAKGLAHVGILQAIDSAGLKIDYITGTSMGSIIGAMYATGYSGNQIDSISKKLNWDILLSGKPKYSDVGLDEKDEFGKYSLEIPMEGLKPKMGTGLIESEEIWLQFSEIFFHVYDQKDFTKFNIPFKCIATNLSNGEAVVLSSGDLVKALRSSMALPSVFSAVEYSDTFLIDGGIVRNFPVSDVKEMGAEFVIGVNLFTGLTEAKDMNSAMDVMYQIMNYRDAYDLVEQKNQCNILIEPPLDNYSAGSFSAGNEILEVGYNLRGQYYTYFKKLADSLNQISAEQYNPYNRMDYKKKVIVDEYEIVGLEKVNKEVLLKKLNLKKGVPLTVKDLNEAFRNSYSTLYFKYIYYELILTQPGHVKLLIHLKEQTLAQFKLGFSYHSFTTPAVIFNYTVRNLMFNKSRTMVKFALSEDFKALAEHQQFFGIGSKNAFAFTAKYIQQKINLYEDDKLANQYKTGNSEVEFRYNYYIARKSTIGAGFSIRNSRFSPNIASTLRFDGNNRDKMLQLSYEINTINRPFLPTKGVEALFLSGVEFNRNYNSNYTGNGQTTVDTSFSFEPIDPLFRAQFHLNWYKPLNSKTNIISNIQGGKVFVDKNYYLDNLLLGGNEKMYTNQYAFVGYMDAQIPATSFTSLLLGVQYKVTGELYFLGKANIGLYNFITSSGFVENINDQFISGLSATVAYNLSVLPFEIGVNYTPELNAFSSYIRIGFIF